MTRPASTAASAEKSGSDAVTITAGDMSNEKDSHFSNPPYHANTPSQDQTTPVARVASGYHVAPTPSEETEGGVLAWLQVAGCFCLYWNSL
jgi:hypothetical protein